MSSPTDLRKKHGPAPLTTAREAGLVPRALAAAPRGSRLPTAAALALALAAAGCALPVDGVGPDPANVTGARLSAGPDVVPASASSAASSGPIEPVPMRLPGEAPMVMPPPPPSASAKPAATCIKPSGSHKTAGKPAAVKTF